jgi:hypothetical protein
MKFENGILYASVGKILTNGQDYSRQIHRLSPEMVKDWYEITEEDYEDILKRQEEQNYGYLES